MDEEEIEGDDYQNYRKEEEGEGQPYNEEELAEEFDDLDDNLFKNYTKEDIDKLLDQAD
jgi:hypothetical protein